MKRNSLIASALAALVLAGGCQYLVPEQHRHLYDGTDAKKAAEAKKEAAAKAATAETLEQENARLKAELAAMKARCGAACAGN
jgi:uncharacterized protein YceH (UPF0502 family)